MAEDEQQQGTAPSGEQGEARPTPQLAGQPEQGPGPLPSPFAAPGDATIPPTIAPGMPTNPGMYPPQPAGGYPLPQQPPTFPPGYAGPPSQYPGYPPTPYPYGPPTPTSPYGYPAPQSQPVAVATVPPWMPPAPPAREPSGLGKPLPLVVTIIIGLAALLVPALAYVIRVLVLQGDWSAGAQLAGIVAAIGLGVAFVAALVRLIAGRRAAVFFILTFLLLAILGSTSAGAVALSNPLHRAQAQNYESQRQWDAAIREYKLYGESGSNAPDIARVYDEWGEQLLAQQSYSDAVDRFLTVLTDYRDSTTAVARAHHGLYQTYIAWLKDSPDEVPYADAVTSLTTYATDPACDTTCKSDIATAAPQALYLYGTQLASDHRYAQAIAQFEKLLSDYAQSDYAPKAHTAAATAYYAEGQAALSQQSCADAVTAYKTLVSKYGDTPEAGKARSELAAPQDVTGSMTSMPTNPVPTAHLSRTMNFPKFQFSNDYSTTPNSKGSFTFKHVKQGRYFFTTSRPVSGGIEYDVWYHGTNKTDYITVTVGPLCATDAGIFPFK